MFNRCKIITKCESRDWFGKMQRTFGLMLARGDGVHRPETSRAVV
jgi:hypothetical protein